MLINTEFLYEKAVYGHVNNLCSNYLTDKIQNKMYTVACAKIEIVCRTLYFFNSRGGILVSNFGFNCQ